MSCGPRTAKEGTAGNPKVSRAAGSGQRRGEPGFTRAQAADACEACVRGVGAVKMEGMALEDPLLDMPAAYGRPADAGRSPHRGAWNGRAPFRMSLILQEKLMSRGMPPLGGAQVRSHIVTAQAPPIPRSCCRARRTPSTAEAASASSGVAAGWCDEGGAGEWGGAPGWDRTSDPWLRRPVLYPLSYGRAEEPDSISRAAFVPRIAR